MIAYVLFIAVLGSGLLMSVADSRPRVMDIVGPKGLLHFLASMRFHVFRFVLRHIRPFRQKKLKFDLPYLVIL